MKQLNKLYKWLRQLPALWQKTLLAVTVLVLLVIVANTVMGFWYTRNFIADNMLYQAEKYQVTIGSNKWGAPHIAGERDIDVAFGLAIAHSKYATEDMTTVLHIARGSHGLIDGQEGSKTDYLIGLVNSREVARKTLDSDQIPQPILDYLTAYVDGLNYYAVQHTDDIDKRLYPVTVVDILASFHLQHLLFFGLQNEVGKLIQLEDSKPAESKKTTPVAYFDSLRKDTLGVIGSNAIAISSGLTWGKTYLVINSHQPNEGPFSWFHASIKSDEGIDLQGGNFPGSPFMFLGFNDDIAWGVTVNHPKLYDRYLLEVSEDGKSYKFDGLWQEFEERAFNIPIKVFDNLKFDFTRTRKFSKHGPVFETPEGLVALHYVTMFEAKAVEQWFHMQKANNLDQWLEAMKLRYIPSFNFVYADKQGNIAYLYNGLLRNRQEINTDSEYLNGTTSVSLNLPYVPFEKLPLVLNPEASYVFSANQNPFESTAYRNAPNPEDFPTSWGIETDMTNRAYVLKDMFKQLRQVTDSTVDIIKYDLSYSMHYDGRKKIERLIGLETIHDSLNHQAIGVLKAWDFTASLDSKQAALGTCLMRRSKDIKYKDILDEQLLKYLNECATLLQARYNTLEPLWKDINKIVRGNKIFPIAGGPDTLRAVYSTYDEGINARRMTAGDGLHFIVSWDNKKQQKVMGIHQYGSNRNPDSIEYSNQIEAFSKQELLQIIPLKDGISRIITYP